MIETHMFDPDGRPLESSGESIVDDPDTTKLDKEAHATTTVIIQDEGLQQASVTGHEALREGLKPGDTEPMPIIKEKE